MQGDLDRAGIPRPTMPKVGPAAMYRLHRALAPRAPWRWLARRLEASPSGYRAFARLEEATKASLFGCRMCAQCALPMTGYACPMTCPKELRNGPCGGVRTDGGCEVHPEMRCVWLVAWERVEQAGRQGDLSQFQEPVDHRRWGQSSWVNYWQGRDEGLSHPLAVPVAPPRFGRAPAAVPAQASKGAP